jgi:hypothetical protein
MSGFINSFQIAYPIQIRWKAGDFGGTVSATMTTTTTTGVAPTKATSTGPPDLVTSPHKSISTGAIVGIAFGGFITLALLAIAILYLFIKKRQFQPPGSSLSQTLPTSNPYEKPELSGTSSIPATQTHYFQVSSLNVFRAPLAHSLLRVTPE